MRSDYRLHPASVLLGLGSQLKNLALPGVLVLVGVNRAGADWEPWLMLLLVPSTLVAIVRYVTFRYRFEPNELVIRSGLVFRNERHVPYARIQNLDAVKNVAHRLLGVVEVHLQTGGGKEPEAVMSVIPVGAFEEMRRRVFQHRDADVDVQQEPAPAPRSILRLSPREILLCGFIENRGVVVIAAAFGLLWELGLADAWFEQVFGEETSGRGLIRSLIAAVMGSAGLSARQVAATLAAFLALFVFVRLLSMLWALIRLYGYELARSDDDLRTAFGLFTRIEATIPLHRIQTLTIEEGPWHRLFKRVGVKVETAGGGSGSDGATTAADRAWLAPVLRSTDLPALLHEVLPEVDLTSVEWHGLDALAFRRAFRSLLMFGLPGAGALVMVLTWWTPALVTTIVVWALVNSTQYVRRTGWTMTATAVVFRSGWIWRSITVAPFAKIQAVALRESPFDRGWGMAAVEVDTAGTGGGRVTIPFLARETAGELHASLAVEASRTEFKW